MKKKKITINSSEKNQQSERKLEYSYQNPSGYMKFENRKVFQEKSFCLKMAELKWGKKKSELLENQISANVRLGNVSTLPEIEWKLMNWDYHILRTYSIVHTVIVDIIFFIGQLGNDTFFYFFLLQKNCHIPSPNYGIFENCQSVSRFIKFRIIIISILFFSLSLSPASHAKWKPGSKKIAHSMVEMRNFWT